MNYCSNCGVELDLNMTHCPLCGSAVNEHKPYTQESGIRQPVFRDKILNDIEKLTSIQRRKLFWVISGIILGSGIVVTLLINFIINNQITWAKYNLAVSLSVFANITLISLWRNRHYLVIICSFISTACLFLMFDLIQYQIGWGTKLGIPILFSLYSLIILVFWLIRITHQKGFNILAFVFLIIGIFLICIEVFISLYNLGSVKLGWSIIAGLCMLPISAVLFFVHYRLKSGIELGRFFHI